MKSWVRLTTAYVVPAGADSGRLSREEVLDA